METTKITVNDVCNFIAKLKETNTDFEIYKYSQGEVRYKVITRNLSIALGKSYISLIFGGSYNNQLEIMISPAEYFRLGELFENSISHCEQLAVNKFFSLFPVDEEVKDIDSLD